MHAYKHTHTYINTCVVSPQDWWCRHTAHHSAPEVAARQLPASQESYPAVTPTMPLDKRLRA